MALKGRFKPKNPEKYRGDASKIIYRSSWELKFLRIMDEDKDVIWYQSEEIAIPYKSPVDGKIHRYFPDVVYHKVIDGVPKTIMVEIKPHAQTLPPNPAKKNNTPTGRISRRYLNEVKRFGINDAKWEAAERFCQSRGWMFVKLTEHDLKYLGIK